MSTPDGDQVENVFHRLPLELKFMIFDQLLFREGQDLIFHADAKDGNLEMLQKVHAWDEAVFEDVMTYLIGDGASRCIFYSNREPRRALYQSLRQLPDTFRRRITRVCLPNFTMRGRPYYDLRDKDVQTRADRTTATAGVYLLQHSFPSICQLDIELDLAEFVLSTYDHTKPDGQRCVSVPISGVIQCLSNFPKIGEMQIRVRWIRVPHCGVDEGMHSLQNQPQKRRALEEEVLEVLRGKIPARSIEDTHAWQ